MGARVEQANVDPYERTLIDRNEPAKQRLLTVGMLIFSLAFCALVFDAGWREISNYEKCGLKGLIACHAVASSPSSAP